MYLKLLRQISLPNLSRINIFLDLNQAGKICFENRLGNGKRTFYIFNLSTKSGFGFP